ncbi:hypothetical protein A6764_20800 [Brevibacillus sp. WF146]|uniref:hypothetical protein n=1 Tax=Brevibacillus sp. WF146 TaxID=319501 RepID=UPI00210013AA|nr:hypothetical protein [Brevibacillus sp. WF146]UYZ13189.1 hypothetical protein A6764_20800 [Brevibacillus sp. WF146]
MSSSRSRQPMKRPKYTRSRKIKAMRWLPPSTFSIRREGASVTTVENVIDLVSDGIETCDGDPIAPAKELSRSQIMPLLNVIVFDVNADGKKQLKQIAQAAEGLYANVTNQEQFQAELERARGIAEKGEKWKRDALSEADAVRIDRRKYIQYSSQTQ